MKRIIEAGRLELKGADARFKQKGTLEAFDRNLAKLVRVRVRQTPAPKLALFADFEFDDAVFRVWQESTLIPYKDFLPAVAPTGLANFRAMVAYATNALPENDLATREFVSGKPPERFATAAELAEYDAAISGGDSPKQKPEASPTEKEKAVAEAWKSFAKDIERERAETRRISPLPGFTLVVMGLMFGAISLMTLREAVARIPDGGRGRGVTYLFVILGLVFSLALLVLGGVFLRRAISSEASRDPA